MKPEHRDRMPAITHVDGSARLQTVTPDESPLFHAVIKETGRRTGIPCVLNTSFNIHEEPIVRTAEDAVRAFLVGHLDYLAIGDYLIRNPKEIEGRPGVGRAVESSPSR